MHLTLYLSGVIAVIEYPQGYFLQTITSWFKRIGVLIYMNRVDGTPALWDHLFKTLSVEQFKECI
jgi:hypothetical protein